MLDLFSSAGRTSLIEKILVSPKFKFGSYISSVVEILVSFCAGSYPISNYSGSLAYSIWLLLPTCPNVVTFCKPRMCISTAGLRLSLCLITLDGVIIEVLFEDVMVSSGASRAFSRWTLLSLLIILLIYSGCGIGLNGVNKLEAASFFLTAGASVLLDRTEILSSSICGF